MWDGNFRAASGSASGGRVPDPSERDVQEKRDVEAGQEPELIPVSASGSARPVALLLPVLMGIRLATCFACRGSVPRRRRGVPQVPPRLWTTEKRLWDHAAGVLIATEAGAKASLVPDSSHRSCGTDRCWNQCGVSVN